MKIIAIIALSLVLISSALLVYEHGRTIRTSNLDLDPRHYDLKEQDLKNRATSNEMKQNEVNDFKHLIDLRNDKELWFGLVNGWNLRWTELDLTYEKHGKTTSLFDWLSKSSVKEMCQFNSSLDLTCGCIEPEQNKCLIEYKYRLISSFGNYITFEVAYHGLGGTMHDSADVRYLTVDLTQKREIYWKFHQDKVLNSSQFYVQLYELFDDAEILKQILNVNTIRTELDDFEIDLKSLKTASELAELIEKSNYQIFVDQKRGISLSDNFMSNYFIKDYKDGKAGVVIRLMAQTNPEVFEDLELELRVPNKLKSSFEAAKSRNEGFLGHFVAEQFQDNGTTIVFHF